MFSPFADHDSISDSRIASGIQTPRRQKHQFRSYLLNGKYERPWVDDSVPKRALKRSNWIIYAFIIVALGLSALINWRATIKISKHDYCLILDDSFSSIDKDIWNQEVQLSGFGTGEFDWATTDSKNAFTDSEGLHINPTLTTETTAITHDQILDNFVLNITAAGGDGSCTEPTTSPAYNSACSMRSNATTKTTLPPVRSARLNTKGKKGITYGRIEVTAKLPSGDWLWPAIWMMPESSLYGPWPRSGEIDIMESKGNAPSPGGQGRDTFLSTLHWGPSAKADGFWRTTDARTVKRTDFSKGFHTFGIEWSRDYMFTYVDSPLQQVLYVDFRKAANMWSRGAFERRLENNSVLTNPWRETDSRNAPFDQKFFLILNVAVGSRNGWFTDGVNNKPWVDGSDSAVADFYAAQDKWYPTWGKNNDRGMTVKNVKMWQEGKCK
ncbi:putative gram-negative bacteria binding protein [Microthyrium microscopicum]|uniref:Putative gram-negative bacteria binding protein n=1 Tax=Microthyrium microscopicum TaxID=703497 RepID=A0A6A6UHK6_9PEZI|nr:putative gram-negative bacteria binding protein [Microthyrium microscopicum]